MKDPDTLATGQFHFTPQQFQSQIATASFMRSLLITAIFISLFAKFAPPFRNADWPDILLFLGMIAWLILTVLAAKINRLTQYAAQLNVLRASHDEVEKVLIDAASRFCINKTVRISIYHQLALLRHRQNRFDEVALITSSILAQPKLAGAASLRSNLLLMLAEAHIHRDDAIGAYTALAALAQQKLTLLERVQCFGLQLRYEVFCGYHNQALHDIRNKLALVDIMPPTPASVCHDLLALAAERSNRKPLADYLRERADLLRPADSDEDSEDASTLMNATPAP